LAEKAKKVLEKNWMGHATKPAPDLYPHQWSWDSAFIAIGYSHFSQERAETELRSLFRGQWRNGMLPHIVFNPESAQYRPGPEFWRTDRSPHASRDPLTSGIMQPPVHASAVWHVYENGADREMARLFLQDMYPKLKGWHDYLYTHHQPDGDGLLYIRHPWGSGQDNSPIWDRILERIELAPEDIPRYERVDTEIVNSEDRPSSAEYDRYAYLVKLAYENGYDEDRIRKVCPFLVQDVLFNTAAVQSNRDLCLIAQELGEDPDPFVERAELTSRGLNSKLWDEEKSMYFDWDLVEGRRIEEQVAAGFSPLYAGIPDARQSKKIADRLNSHAFCRLDHVCLTVPSYDKESDGFSSHLYWRGPIWINVNYLLYHGLRRYGIDDYAERVKSSIIKLTSESGMYEYYDPETGSGHGAADFSWTAALLLDILYEEEGIR
jgi:glycogen debranching enzyme